MVVRPELTPNPNALKFSVGRETGEPKTFVKGGTEGDPIAMALLALEGVVSVFMTADFVPLTKADILTGRCWSLPVLHHGRIYARNLERVVCFDLR